MLMKCPNCNGVLVFDITNQMLKCTHCGGIFEPDLYEKDNSAQENEYEGLRLYTCRNCGAELLAHDDTAVTYCSYCGSETVLNTKMEGQRAPRYIIPFKISKQQCKNRFQKELRDKFYVPKELKDPDFIDRFRGIYIPYWMYYIKFREDPFDLQGSRSYTRGNYDYYEEYEVTAKIHDQGLYGVPYDASRNFDDSIAEEIAPFHREDLVDYRSGYLAGMYADCPNVGADVYEKDVKKKATDTAIADINKDFRGITLKYPSSEEEREAFFRTQYIGHDAVYLPVWFLTWKKGDRVAYAVVNGQTGKVHVDLPIDRGEFFKYSALAALVLFFILQMFLTVTSRTILSLSALLVLLVGYGFLSELKKIRNMENHVFDKGYLIQDSRDLSMSEKKREKIRKRSFSLSADSETDRKAWVVKVVLMTIAASFGMFIVLPLMLLVFDLVFSDTGAALALFLILILELIQFIRCLFISRHLKRKTSILTGLFGLAAVAAGFMTAVIAPVEDWWYYIGAMISLAAAVCMSLDLISRYNDLSTRPLPSFYERTGGNDHAKG